MKGRSCILVLAAACASPHASSSHPSSSHPTQSGNCPSNAGVSAGCGVVPHDDCLTDLDCGDDAVCSCQTPVPAGEQCPGGVPLVAGNVCIPANCRADSDCSVGMCLEDNACGAIAGLYCWTASDECKPGTSNDGKTCVFQSGRWRLEAIACPG